MEDSREKKAIASKEPASAYRDALYSQAPTEGPSYGYNLAQCYARVSGGAQTPSQKKKKHSGAGFLAAAAFVLICVLAVGLFGSGSMILSGQASAAGEETPSREIYEDYTAAAGNEYDECFTLEVPEETELEELPAQELYAVACSCTVGVTVPGYASNVFGQVSSTTVNGSGIVLTEDGYILTNYHVIQAAYTNGAQVLVFTYNGTEHEAEVVGVETDSDIAVLKIEIDESDGLAPAWMGDSSEINVGQPIYAVGNPLGELTFSMTSGIVSALDRRITTDENVTVDMFQIDAAINNGNSGGPVFNAYGQVIGVVTAKFSLSGMEGLGFAIPINDACEIARDLVEKGYVSGKAYLGLTMATVSSSAARYYDMVEGVYIYGVEEGSCAEKAGLQVGDVITAIDGQSVLSEEELAKAVKQYRAGDRAELTVYRGQDDITITVVFDEELPAGAEEPDQEELLRSAVEDMTVREG